MIHIRHLLCITGDTEQVAMAGPAAIAQVHGAQEARGAGVAAFPDAARAEAVARHQRPGLMCCPLHHPPDPR